jgi:hypothetical protein
LTIDVLSPLYGVSRATVARWLSTARQALAAEARRCLQAELACSTSECESLFALLNGHLHFSLSRHLREA